jgi:hypothetical protein
VVLILRGEGENAYARCMRMPGFSEMPRSIPQTLPRSGIGGRRSKIYGQEDEVCRMPRACFGVYSIGLLNLRAHCSIYSTAL